MHRSDERSRREGRCAEAAAVGGACRITADLKCFTVAHAVAGRRREGEWSRFTEGDRRVSQCRGAEWDRGMRERMRLEERKEASEEGCRGKRGTGKEEGEGEGGLCART